MTSARGANSQKPATQSPGSGLPATPICQLPTCDLPIPPERVTKGAKFCSFDHKSEAENVRKKQMRGSLPATPTTRRCRSKLCIERFVPTNRSHWYHEPACSTVPEDMKWEVDDILAEEGSLLPGGNHLEMAKAAFGQKNTALRENSRLRSLRDYLTFEVKAFYDENPEFRYPTIPTPPKDTGKKGERELLVQISDWQVGKWEQGFGVEATKARVERLKASVASIVQRQRDAGYKVNRLHVCVGGDMLEGCFIYRGQNVSGLDRSGNTHRLTVQIRVTAHMLAEFVAFCAALGVEVVVHIVGGNHGRPNGPNDYADPEDNFDVMIGWWARDLMANNPRIKWDISENWWNGFEVMGHYCVSIHGDQWVGPFSKLETLLPQWVASGVFGRKPVVFFTAHRHEERQMEVSGIPVFQNGCIDGGSGWYLRQFGRASRPFQRVLTFSEKYVPESQWPVYFQSHVSGAFVA